MAEEDAPQEMTPYERKVAALKPTTWVKGQSGNPAGRPKTAVMIQALFDMGMKDGRVEQAVNEYFDLMLHATDPRLRFAVLTDFFDRYGLRAPSDPKVAAQIINVVRSNSPELNL